MPPRRIAGALARIIHEKWSGAVSYTHLDVYKRQHSEGIEYLGKRAGRTLSHPVELRSAVPGLAVVFFAIPNFAVVVVHIAPIFPGGLRIGVDKILAPFRETVKI